MKHDSWNNLVAEEFNCFFFSSCVSEKNRYFVNPTNLPLDWASLWPIQWQAGLLSQKKKRQAGYQVRLKKETNIICYLPELSQESIYSRELLYFSRLKYINHLRRRPGPLDLHPRVRSVICCFFVAGNKTGPQMNPQTQPKQLPGPPNLNGCKIQYPLYQITTHSAHKTAIRPNWTVHKLQLCHYTLQQERKTPYSFHKSATATSSKARKKHHDWI